MNSEEFSKYRKILKITQKEMADLLGVALKTFHSYEQGWREIPSYIERQVFFLLSNRREKEHLTLLGNKTMRNEGEMSSLGVSKRTSLLVFKWNVVCLRSGLFA